ncbi:MAG: hypothetical protein Q8P88_01935 [Candidatus Jorgensenbacteria bacterium]|nr:hypothetical protein [Candidatus Jorgensenbacteria bacterium]
MESVGAVSLTKLFPGVETIALRFGKPEALAALKPRTPMLTDREWLLLAGRFGVKNAYHHCFIEYWKRRGGGSIEEFFAKWLEEANLDPSYAPVEAFVS